MWPFQPRRGGYKSPVAGESSGAERRPKNGKPLFHAGVRPEEYAREAVRERAVEHLRITSSMTDVE